MHKLDNDVSNIDELSPTDHLLMHKIFNSLCKPLMERGIVGYTNGEGYYLIETTTNKKE